MDKTNKERLATIEEAIVNIDKNVDEFKIDNKEQWKQINKNTISISVGKAISGIIAFVISVGTTILVAFGMKH